MVGNLRTKSYHYASIQCIFGLEWGENDHKWGETAQNGGKTFKMLGIYTIMLVSMVFSSIPYHLCQYFCQFPPIKYYHGNGRTQSNGGYFPPIFDFPPILKWQYGGKIMSPSTSIMGGKYRFPSQASLRWGGNSPPIVLFSPHLKFHFPPIMGGKNNLWRDPWSRTATNLAPICIAPELIHYS